MPEMKSRKQQKVLKDLEGHGQILSYKILLLYVCDRINY